MKTALREVVAMHQPEVHLTPANNVILANLVAAQQHEITRVFAEHGVQTEREHGDDVEARDDRTLEAAHDVQQLRRLWGQFDAAERPAVAEVLNRAGQQVECWLNAGLKEAMNNFNGAAPAPLPKGKQ